MDISKLSDEQFAQVFQKIIEKIKEDPIENLVKAQGFLDLTPTPAQEVILKIVFNKELDPYELKEVRIEAADDAGEFALKKVLMTEYQIYEFLTEEIYDSKRAAKIKINKINLICGRRSGKTLLAAIIAIYCCISNNWKPFLKKTPFATVLILSHSREFSDEVLELIRTLIEASDILMKLINKDKKNTAATMNLQTPWIVKNEIVYSRVQIKVAAASSKTTRGIAACAIICDEIAFWAIDENMKESDEKILKAVQPSMKQFKEFAMLIKLSSPYIKQGVLFNEYRQLREGTLPKTYAVFKAASWVMSPEDILSEPDLKEDWQKDRDSFDLEYRSNFSDSYSNFILPEYIDLAVLRGVTFQAPDPEVRYKAAIDAAFTGDTFTFSVSGFSKGRCKQYLSKGWKGSKSKPVSAFEVAEFVRAVSKQYGLQDIAADQFSFQPLKEIFEKFGLTLTQYTFNPEFKKKIYFNLKKLFHSQQIDLLDNERQSRELKELIVEQRSSGIISIRHPTGRSDDFADSLAISAFLATEEVGLGQFDFHSNIGVNTYGMNTDSNGISFGAPSTELLVNSGHLPPEVSDNLSQYVKDPKTGKLRHIDEEDDLSLDDDKFGFSF